MLQIKGYWQRTKEVLKVSFIVENAPKKLDLTFSNQTGIIGRISVEGSKKKVSYTVSMIEEVYSDYILVSGSLLVQLQTSKLTLDINKQIGDAVISFSESVLNQIDGLLASL